MKAFYERYRKLHIWLGTNIALLILFFAVCNNGAWMDFLAQRVIGPLRMAIGRLCYRVSFSVAEVLCILLVIAAAAYLVWSMATVIRAKGQRWRQIYRAVLGALCAGLTIYNGMCFLWGIQYTADGFEKKSGIYAREVSVEELADVTKYFAQRLSETSGQVVRDENGLFAVPREKILADSTKVYGAISQQYPFLKFQDEVPKTVGLSRLMSVLDFTGVYCPFTGESNVNVDSPACFLPSTIAHELAHQRGFASEQECNFIAILSSTTCGMEEYAYSGWLLGYVHLGNALHTADSETWKAVYDGLPEEVHADLRHNNEYWKQFEHTPAKKISNKVYDQFLKNYGEQDGLKSYGTVVDLLVAYYQQ